MSIRPITNTNCTPTTPVQKPTLSQRLRIGKIIQIALVVFLVLLAFPLGAESVKINNWHRGPLPSYCKPYDQYAATLQCPRHIPAGMEIVRGSNFQDLVTPNFLCPNFSEKLPILNQFEIVSQSDTFKIFATIATLSPDLLKRCEDVPKREQCLSPYDLISMAQNGAIDIDELRFENFCRRNQIDNSCDLTQALFYSLKGMKFAQRQDKEITLIASVTTQNDPSGAFEINHFRSLNAWRDISSKYPIIFYSISSVDNLQFRLEDLKLNNKIVKIFLLRAHGSATSIALGLNEQLSASAFLKPERTSIDKTASIILDSCNTGQLTTKSGEVIQDNILGLFARSFPGARVTGPTQTINANVHYTFRVLNDRPFFTIIQDGKVVSKSQICNDPVREGNVIKQDCYDMSPTDEFTTTITLRSVQ